MDLKKKRKIYIAILVSLTVIICTAAVAVRIGLFSKKIVNTFNKDYSSKKTTENMVLSDGFSEICIDAEIGEFIIETGETYSVDYDFPSGVTPEITTKNGKLLIEVKPGNKNKNKINSFAIMSKHTLTITVPEETDLANISIEVNAGSIEIENIKTKETTIITDAGSVDIRNCTLGDCNIEAAAGSVDIRESSLGNCDVKTDAGSIDLKSCETQNCSMVTSMGSINLKKCNIADGDFTLDLGSLALDGDFNSLSAVCSLGSIDVKSGNIEGKKMQLETDLGSISVNGSGKGSSFSQ